MEPLAQVRAMIAIESEGLELVGIYHSHPTGPASPSPSDVAQAWYPDAAQIIISLAAPGRSAARAFLIREGQVFEIRLVNEPHDNHS
jgi:proteasome lid subunit RPN8/RPN11